ncbi:5-formyltetrahydrofolate cyclo-ligase [Simkania sp.]|uniref:5-formyltetrahydrofolate cyclo-ligase n=1 Tax=Simkania sp. TaxID=34094 RepID=UPI003B52D2EE
MNLKHELRRKLIERRLEISPHRRNEAREEVMKKLLPLLEGFKRILSFASKEEEIDLWPLNELLAKDKKLCLTKVEEERLSIFQVSDIELDLAETGRWQLKEPIPSRCSPITPKEIDCALVPGLGFDKQHHRIGYGMGHFDRFLLQVSCPTYGVGFREQLLESSIPAEEHDISLTKVFYF